MTNEKILVNGHNLIMENREKLNISGISEVKSFDEQTVALKTAMGDMTVRGDGLKVVSYDEQSGDIVLTGSVIAIVYTNDNSHKSGFFERIFK